MKTIKTEPPALRHAEHPTAGADLEGERLEAARSEFQAAWETTLARREQRLKCARHRIAACHRVTLLVGVLGAACGWGLGGAAMFPAAPRLLVQGLTLVMILAFALFFVLLGGVSLWAGVVDRLEEREIRHL